MCDTIADENVAGSDRRRKSAEWTETDPGSDVGYRWYARKHETPLFPFGFGLSYTAFSEGNFGVSEDGGTRFAHLRVRNVGQKPGKEAVEVYLTRRPEGARLRLAAFTKVNLLPGESKDVSLPIDHRILADWSGSSWALASGEYQFAVGKDAANLGETAIAQISFRVLPP